MPDKELILGVDYNDDVSAAFERGEVGDTPLIEAIMDDAVKAGMATVCWRVSACGPVTYRTRVGTPMTGLRAPFENKTDYGLIMKRIDPLRVAVDAAHERGLRMVIDCAIDDHLDELDDSPARMPVHRDKNPEGFFQVLGEATRRMLATSADGILFYEHRGADDRTWETIRSARGG